MHDTTRPEDPMRDLALPAQLPPAATLAASQKSLRSSVNERTAGTIPVWDSRPSAQVAQTEEAALSLSPQSTNPEESFGFGDFIDMVNPLQHIPVLNTLYREFTGDMIKPVSQIIGGIAFGGPVGGVATLANLVIEKETGKDLTALALNLNGHKSGRTRPHIDRASDPETSLTLAYQQEENDIAGALLAFSDLKHGIAVEEPSPAPKAVRLHDQPARYND